MRKAYPRRKCLDILVASHVGRINSNEHRAADPGESNEAQFFPFNDLEAQFSALFTPNGLMFLESAGPFRETKE